MSDRLKKLGELLNKAKNAPRRGGDFPDPPKAGEYQARLKAKYDTFEWPSGDRFEGIVLWATVIGDDENGCVAKQNYDLSDPDKPSVKASVSRLYESLQSMGMELESLEQEALENLCDDITGKIAEIKVVYRRGKNGKDYLNMYINGIVENDGDVSDIVEEPKPSKPAKPVKKAKPQEESNDQELEDFLNAVK